MTLLADQFTQTIYVLKQIARKCTSFYDASEISQHTEWMRYTPGMRQISSSELLSTLTLGFGELGLGLDKGSFWCSPQMWPEFHPLCHRSRERYSSSLSRRSAFMMAFY